ncbi:MAG: hypothetical protein EOP34_04795 [Rickettsiales bacterium]|nr:MAG: hypothetical protein EOP34_04795 [Rickettsiales bacterium]
MKYIIILIALISCYNKKNIKDSIKNENLSNIDIDDKLSIDNTLENIKLPPKAINNDLHNSDNVNSSVENIKYNNKNQINKYKLYSVGHRGKYVKPSILINDQFMYVSDNNILKSYNLNNLNDVLWSKNIRSSESNKIFPYGGMLYDNNVIYLTAGHRDIIAIDAMGGREIWRKSLNNIVRSTPVINDNMLLISTIDNSLYVLNKDDGKISWKYEGLGGELSVFGAVSPFIYDGIIILPTSSGQILALSINGDVIWDIDLSFDKSIIEGFTFSNIDITPIVKDDKIFISGNMGALYAIDLYSGQILWKQNLKNIKSFWVADNYLYVIDNNKLYAININNGSVKWFNDLDEIYNVEGSKKNKKYIYYGPIIVNDELLVVSNKGFIAKISPYDGSKISVYNVTDNVIDHPIVTTDSIYLINHNSLIVIK